MYTILGLVRITVGIFFLTGLEFPLWNTQTGGIPEPMSTDSNNSTLRTILLVIAIVLGILLVFRLLMMLFGISMSGMMGGGFAPGGMPGSGGMSPVLGFGMFLLLLAVVGGLGYLLYQSLS